MKEIILVLDLVLDEDDMDRLRATSQPYLYRSDSNELYLKHLQHLDFHHPNVVLSYAKEHKIINLERKKIQSFYITNEGLTKPYGVALGVTDCLAMIALGDTNQTKIQIIDVNSPLKVFLNTVYEKDTEQLFPIPKLFSGNSKRTTLSYFDGSTLDIDLDTFEVKRRQKSTSYQSVPKILSPFLSILGPFILLHITSNMTKEILYSMRSLVNVAINSSWIAIDTKTVFNRYLVKSQDFTEIIIQRDTQIQKIKELIEKLKQP